MLKKNWNPNPALQLLIRLLYNMQSNKCPLLILYNYLCQGASGSGVQKTVNKPSPVPQPKKQPEKVQLFFPV